MSSNLYWKPIKTRYDLPDELKNLLKLEYQLPTTLTNYDLGFLKGLIVCNIKGAKQLYDAIEKFEEVEVYEEY